MRFHKGNDGWGRDSYSIPQFAVAGCSVTDEQGPAPASMAKRECIYLRSHIFKETGVRARFKATPSGNCFMHKAWVTVPGKDYKRVLPAVEQWLVDHRADTRLIHDAR